MPPPDILQELLTDQASDGPQNSLSLTTLIWDGRCTGIDAEGGYDDEEVGKYIGQGDPRPLRLSGWSDEHSALVYEPTSPIEFEYTRRDSVGHSGSNMTYYGAYVGEPEEHGPLFALHASKASPYEKMKTKKRPPFHFSVGDYFEGNRKEPAQFFKNVAMLPLPDLAAEEEAKANGTRNQEEPPYEELYERWADNIEPDSTIRPGWSGPWARNLISLSRQRPAQSLGTMASTAWHEVWAPYPHTKKVFGIELSLETISVHAEPLFEPWELPEDTIKPSDPTFEVIDKYTIRATVLRVFVGPSFFSPTAAGQEADEESEEEASDDDDEPYEEEGFSKAEAARLADMLFSGSKRQRTPEVQEEDQETRPEKRRKRDDTEEDE